MSKNQFTGTATQPQCIRKFCQFNNDQYCSIEHFSGHTATQQQRNRKLCQFNKDQYCNDKYNILPSLKQHGVSANSLNTPLVLTVHKLMFVVL